MGEDLTSGGQDLLNYTIPLKWCVGQYLADYEQDQADDCGGFHGKNWLCAPGFRSVLLVLVEAHVNADAGT